MIMMMQSDSTNFFDWQIFDSFKKCFLNNILNLNSVKSLSNKLQENLLLCDTLREKL